ncbi:MAG: T9SS type A sorting domain-containing protein [Ignavibacteriaceae bacterium]
MKRLFTILVLLFLSAYSFAQTPQVSIPITINDGGSGSQVLYFGLDPTATDGIDGTLGEAVLPPIPPAGGFDARFNLPNGTESSLSDYRQGSNSYSGSKEYNIQYQVGNGTVINLSWNFMPGVTGRLQDIVLGSLIDVNMTGSGSYVVSNPGVFVRLKMTITYTPPTLSLPANGATNVWLTPTFTWSSVTNATKYGLYVATNSDFSNIVFSDTTITATSKTLTSALNTNTLYYWRIIGISENGRAIYSETRSFTTAQPIGWANLQWPSTASISVGESMIAYAQIWIEGITVGSGAGSGVSAWIGYSTSNTNPNTWTNWVPASYNTDVGNNDEYMASIGSTLPAGTYYFASRFQYAGGDFYYGGFSGGAWNGTTNVSGVLTVQLPLPGIPTLSSPANSATNVDILPTFVWNSSSNATLYRLQIATDAGFTSIVFNDSTITDTSFTLTTPLDNNRQYFWRVKAKNASGSSDFSSPRSFTTKLGIGWANLQFPATAGINIGGSATFYARVYASGITEPAGQGAGITAWIGYSTANTNPSTWTDWVPATYNADYDNNDEYNATFGSSLAAGTYYVASRFLYNSTEIDPSYKYGGYSSGGGGYWDGTNNISSVLTVTATTPPPAPNLVSPINSATGQSTLPTLVWNASSGATSYRLIIATDTDFSNVVYNDSTITDTSKTLTNALENNRTYYWKVNAKNGSGTSSYSTTWNFTTMAVISWANLQFPGNASIDLGGSATYYSRVYAQNITEPSGQGAGITGWIGYSTTNTNPNTWTNWVPANYNTDQGNNDEYQAVIGSTLPSGTYYVASRFLLSVTEDIPNYVYGGYSTDGGGIWNGTNYVSATLSVSVPAPSAPTLVSPINNITGVSTLPTLTWNTTTNATSYRLIIATNSDFSDVVFNDSTITDTSKTLISALQNNKTYYWKVNAKNGSGTSSYSTTWNFTTMAVISWANLQFPGSAAISLGGSATYYSRVYAQNITEPVGQGAGITAWIGYSTSNTNPNTWTNWVPATYNTDQGNNDEYQAAIGSTLASGTYYVASRFLLGSTETPANYVYGGYSTDGGGYWDGTTNVSATLNIAVPAPDAPTLVSPLNNATGQSTTPTLTWNSSATATSYRLMIATDNGFTDVIFNDSTITDTAKTLVTALQNNKTYYWKVNAKNGSGTSSYSTTWNFTTMAVISWANLQFPGNASIDLGGSATYYSRVYAQNITEPSGQGAGITAWIGYSTTNTNPNTWTNWVPATYNTDQGNNDEYQAVMGSTLPSGTYYVASRFLLSVTEDIPNYVYGGYSTDGGGIWNGTNYVSATLSVSVPAPSAPTLVSPINNITGVSTLPTLTWNTTTNATSYRLIIATNSDFSDVVFNDSTITDTSKTLISALQNNKTYYWKVNAKNGSGTSAYSTVWNFKTVAVIGWANLQFPGSTSIDVGGSATFYSRVYVQNLTEPSGQGAGITAWIGYSASNTNPNTWTSWVPATYNTDQGNNDEYQAILGSTLASGTYYVASRFLLGSTETPANYVYGGYSTDGGGYWDGTTNVSATLNIAVPAPVAPTLVSPLNNATGQSTTPTLTWNSSATATSYRLMIATDNGFTDVIFNDSTITDTAKTLVTALQNNKTYYWKVNAKNGSGTSSYSTTWNFTTMAVISWANLQFPGNASIDLGGSATYYSRVYAQNITEPSGQGAGITAWIGYGTTNTNPNTWTNWVPATYNTDQGNNDEYQAILGSTLASGTYFVASRFQLVTTKDLPNYVYGGYSTDGGGYWDGTNYVSATLSVAVPSPGAPSLMSPVNNATGISTLPTLTWNTSVNAISYRLVIATDQNFNNTVFNDSTITDTSKSLIAALQNNTTYYWKVNAKNGSGTSAYSTVWNFKTIAVIGWANLQFPGSAAISLGGSATYYSRVYAQNITEPVGQGAGITGWIGYSTSNTNPNTWTNWVPATYNTDQGNNDEYQAILGSTLASGTYYVASRFLLGSTETPANYVYGGYSEGGGGFWNGTTYVSATLSVAVPAPVAPTLVSPLNDATGVSTLPTLTWNSSSNATSYRLIIATNSDFSDVVFNDSTITDTSKTLTSALQNNKKYYWKVNAKNTSGTSNYSDTRNFRTIAIIGWANLQFPGTAAIDLGGSATFYSRVFAQNITEPSGQGEGISAWIGYSTTNTNPNTWTNWIPATYGSDQGNNDEYQAVLGSALSAGNYYVASRFQLNVPVETPGYVYGGYSATGGGFWDGTNYMSATLSVSVPLPSTPTLVSPLNNATGVSTLPVFTWNASANATSYRLIIATNSDFSDVVFNDSTITDTSKTLISALQNNKEYFWKVNAKNGSGTSGYSEVRNFTTIAVIGWANLQWPPAVNINQGDTVTVYARIWAEGITNVSGAGPGIQGWIGYNSTNNNPAGWTNWIPAVFNIDAGNNDEYMANIGATLPVGMYYYASRFQLNSGEYKYGGYNVGGGGFWDSTNNVSGVLIIATGLPAAPVLAAPFNNSYDQPVVMQFKWNRVTTAVTYRLQVATDQNFSSIVYNDSTITDSTDTLSSGLLNNTTYYWKVSAKNPGGTGPSSEIWNFRTAPEVPLLTNLWQMNSGSGNLPSWFSTNGSERGIAFGSINPVLETDDRLYVASRNGGIFVRILNASNGVEVGTLNNTGISGGDLPINDVETSQDGKIFVCNLTENASVTPFKVYMWNNESAVPTTIISWIATDAVKLGDKFTVTGTYSDNSAVIYAASESNGINKVYKWTMSGGSFSTTPTVINLTSVEPGVPVSASVGPLPNGDFYWNASLFKLRKYTSAGALIDTIPTAVAPLQSNAVRYIGKVGNKEYAVVFQYGNINENARVIEITDNNYALATIFGTTATLGSNSNTDGYGDVTFRINPNGSADIFVLSTNNGIGRYQTVQPVPVELTSFSSSVSEDNVKLDWSTATESNSKEFIVERSAANLEEWNAIASLPSSGNSVIQNDYSYTDKHVKPGKYDYRLRMVDVDGTWAYSQTLSVETGTPVTFNLLQNYPNPFNPSTVISYQLSEGRKVKLTVYDAVGNEIATLVDRDQPAGYHSLTFDAANLTSGIYFYELRAGEFMSVKKFVLMK